MGSTYSKNAVNAAINVISNVAISATNTCQTVYSQEQGFSVCANNSNVDIGNISFNEAIYTNIDCLNDPTVLTTINNDVSQTISQVATAISQAFQLPTGGTDAQNVANATVDIANSVVEAFNQTCNVTLTQNQNVSICGSNNTVIVGDVNFNETIDSTVSCIQKVLSENGVTNKVSQAVSQTATAKVDSILGAILMILIIIVVMVILVMFGGFKEITNPVFLITVAVLIVVYLIIAYYFKIWPFSNSSSTPSMDNTTDDGS